MSSVDHNARPSFEEDEISLQEIATTLRRGRRLIAIVTAVALTIAVFYVLLARPRFDVTGSLYLGDTHSNSPAAGALSSLSFLSGFAMTGNIASQVEVIKSRALVEQAILQSGLNARITTPDAWNLRYVYWRLIDGASIGAYAPGPHHLEALYATLSQPGANPVGFTLTFSQQGAYRISAEGHTVLRGTLGSPASGGGLSLLIKPAQTGFIPKAHSRFHLQVTPVGVVYEDLLKGPLSVGAARSGVKFTEVVHLGLQNYNPYAARQFLNTLMRDYIAMHLRWKTQSAGAMEGFVESQLGKIRSALTHADNRLAAYQQKSGIVSVPDNAKAAIREVSHYELERTQARLHLMALNQVAQNLAHPHTALNPYLLSQTGDLVLGQLTEKLAAAQTQYRALRVEYTPAAPVVEIKAAQIHQIQQAITHLIDNQQHLAQAELTNLNGLIARYDAEVRALPARSLKVLALTRSSEVLGKIYVLLMEKEQEAALSKAATISDTRVLSPAVLPLHDDAPKPKLIVILALLLGLMSGAGWVLVRRMFSAKYESEEEIRKAIRLPLYGLIPEWPRKSRAETLFTAAPQSASAEAFRVLRSNLYRSAPGTPNQVIVVTSASPNDGKTTTACYLAQYLAEDGKRVVVIDADLHKPELHTFLAIDLSPGLSDGLSTEVTVEPRIVPQARFVAIPGGVIVPNPMEMLSSPRMAAILADLRSRYDFIVIDCPPFPAVADATTLVAHADLLFVVTRPSNTLRRALAALMEHLVPLSSRAGLIINGVGGAEGYGYGYGYGYGKTAPAGRLDRLRAWFKKVTRS